jgi:hypothetical protein
VVPKAEDAELLARVATAAPRAALLPPIETAAALDALRRVAGAKGSRG